MLFHYCFFIVALHVVALQCVPFQRLFYCCDILRHTVIIINTLKRVGKALQLSPHVFFFRFFSFFFFPQDCLFFFCFLFKLSLSILFFLILNWLRIQLCSFFFFSFYDFFSSKMVFVHFIFFILRLLRIQLCSFFFFSFYDFFLLKWSLSILFFSY